jgi:hypothetical protein
MGISQMVREALAARPCLSECLKQGVVNYSAAARLLARELGIKDKDDAIKMALIRSQKRSEPGLEEKLRKLIASSVLELRTDLAVLHLDRRSSDIVLRNLAKISGGQLFSQVSIGSRFLTIIIGENDTDKVLEGLSVSDVIRVIRDQAAIILVSPLDVEETPGFISYVTSLLSVRGINITEILSCYSDTVIVLRRGDALRAYQILENVILKERAKQTIR